MQNLNSSVLYRKYRPQTFSSLKGQEVVKNILINSLKNNSFSQAYLFAGPRGTGKTSTARLFAKAINFQDFGKYGDIGDESGVLYEGVPADDSTDIIEIDAASNRKIEDIRNLRDTVNFLPVSLKYKIYIIDEAHMLTKEAFNALLKTLEEPPAHVIFLLATTEAEKLPVTILSRLVRLDFGLADSGVISSKLQDILSNESVSIEPDALDVIIKLAKGSYRDSESLLAKVISFANQNENSKVTKQDIDNIFNLPSNSVIEEFLEMFANKDINGLKVLFGRLEQNGVSANSLVENCITYIISSGGSHSQLLGILIELVENRTINRLGYLYILAKISGSGQVVKNSVASSEESEVLGKEEIVEISPVPASSANKNGNFYSSVKPFAEARDARIMSILSSSEFGRKADVLHIKNKYEFNCKLLRKDENIVRLHELAKLANIADNMKSIFVSVDGPDSDSVEKSKDSKDVSFVSGNISEDKAEPEEHSFEEVRDESGNSDGNISIVEKLL